MLTINLINSWKSSDNHAWKQNCLLKRKRKQWLTLGHFNVFSKKEVILKITRVEICLSFIIKILPDQTWSGSRVSEALLKLFQTSPESELKTLDTIGNCQRPVFSLSESQHMHKITNLRKFELNWSSKLRDNNERKCVLATRSCVLSDAWFQDLKI